MKFAALMPSKIAASVTADDGFTFTVTATFSNELETDFKAVKTVARTTERYYYLEYDDGSFAEIPPGYLYLSIVHISKD